MPAASHAVIVLAQALGLGGPRWSIEAALVDQALRGDKYGSAGARFVLRRGRELAASRSPRTIPPTLEELTCALDADIEARIALLVRLLLSELERALITEGRCVTPEADGGDSPPEDLGVTGAD